MPRFVPIIFILLLILTGCGYHGCISQANVYEDTVRSVVFANSGEKGEKDGSQYWTKVDFPLSGKKLNLQIEHHHLNFCENAQIDVMELRIPDSDPISADKQKEFKFTFPVVIMPGEEIRFFLNPVNNFTIDDETCRNGKADIRVSDIDACLSSDIGNKYPLYFSSKLGRGSGYYNSWYKVDKGAAPYIDDVPEYLHISGGGALKKPSATEALYEEQKKLLCLNQGELEEYVDKLLEEEKKANKDFDGVVNGSAAKKEKRDKKLAEVRAKVRGVRKKFESSMDGYSLNMHCKKLCTGSVSESDAKEECKGYHKLLQVREEEERDVIPFVKLKENSFVLSKFEKQELPKGVEKAQVPKEFARDFEDSKLAQAKAKGAAFGQSEDYLVLNRAYTVNTAGTLVPKLSSKKGDEISLFVKVPQEVGSIAGSYTLSVKKDCSAHIENSLYYVFSETPPTFKPGPHKNGSKKIDFTETGSFTINAESEKGDLYFGIHDNGDGYENNVGYFEIQTKAHKTPPRVFGYIVSWTEGKVRSALYGTSETNNVVRNLYRHISQSGPFMRMVNALLVLYVIVSALYFCFGFSRASIFQLFITVMKIMIVMYVLRPDSWTFFNNHLLNVFIDGPKFLIDAMTGGVGSGGDFGFLDGILYRFSVTQTWIQLLALIFAGPIGWLSVILIFWGIIVLVQCLFQAVVIYLVSIMTIALLLCIAPYFLICVLFKRTKNIFDMWIKVLLQTAMQPVLIFSCIALLVHAINEVIYAMLNFEVCDTCVFNIDLKMTTLCLLSFPLPIGIIPMTPITDTIREIHNTGEAMLIGLPGPIFNILIFLALVHAARDFVLNSGEMSSIMFGAFTNLSEVGATAAQSLLSVVGMDRNTGQMLEQHKHQSELFSRGPGAGRQEGAFSGMMRGFGGAQQDSGGVRRRPVIRPEDPPASF
ncbi:TrbL/VirB6 plasmid conjugal transfer protein [Anaplasma phagocytophilum]|uniref:TrbL/VirB6 plasmid conjugal transfer protein n=1 Tax=Anaplasma phagocytophilum TaxID=948 RepID=A0AA45ZHK9_ANAPH|nr:type IV secretion system protein [Anaplasma phagocytophilum]SBO14427.1 TrbL/VirB6 plasmid conjugal transfer protein [Anaplasma phagocytophilum]